VREGPAGAIRDAVTGAVGAAQDPQAFAPAADRLAALDPARVGVLLGWVVRTLLEELHPGGVDGEDVRAALTGCVSAWPGEADPAALVVVLTGALGLSDPPVAPAAVARNAVLLVAHLLGPRPLAPYLDAAFTDLRRAETIEMP
jgi:hypothetical protein